MLVAKIELINLCTFAKYMKEQSDSWSALPLLYAARIAACSIKDPQMLEVKLSWRIEDDFLVVDLSADGMALASTLNAVASLLGVIGFLPYKYPLSKIRGKLQTDLKPQTDLNRSTPSHT